MPLTIALTSSGEKSFDSSPTCTSTIGLSPATFETKNIQKKMLNQNMLVDTRIE